MITKKAKSMALLVIILIITFVTILYVKYQSLNEYVWDGDLVEHNGIYYQDDISLSKEYSDGKLKTGEIIGRFKGDSFLGFKTMIRRLHGIDKKDAFMVNGMMFDIVYSRIKST